jgi:hypothetical protein
MKIKEIKQNTQHKQNKQNKQNKQIARDNIISSVNPPFIEVRCDSIFDFHDKLLFHIEKGRIKNGYYQCVSDGSLLPNNVRRPQIIKINDILYYLWPIPAPHKKQQYIYSRRHLV